MPRNFLVLFILLGLLVSSLSICPAADPVAAPILPAGGMEAWWADASRALEAMEYELTEADGLLQAPNREQNLRALFREEGVEVTPRTWNTAGDRWRFAWVTESWGRAGSLQPVAATSPRSQGARVEFRYDVGLTEWYVNHPEGLEQGFTIAERPAGSGSVVIAGQFDVKLAVRLLSDQRQIDFLNVQGDCVFRYGGLYVDDATGKRLPSHLEVDGETIRIVFDDNNAIYPVTVDPLMTSPSWSAEGNQTSAYFGYQVATAGDVNGDGFSDVVVGAHNYDAGQEDEGCAFGYFGSASGLSTTPDWISEGDQVDAGHGFSVATAGDINGDGYDDVIVGVPFFDEGGGTNGGAVRLYHGSASGLSSWPSWGLYTMNSDWQIGRSVATAGDVNGDGYDDIIYGAFYYSSGESLEGGAWVRYGSADGILNEPSWHVQGNQENATLGRSVATAGDVNGDGYADVIIGADGYDLSFTNNGRASVYLGSASGVQSTPIWEYHGQEHGANFGYSVATAGDVNGDGFSDIIVGSPNESDDIGTPDEGLAFVFYGSTGGPGAFPGWIGEADQDESRYGFSVGTAGDVDGDGFADVIVGAWQWNGGQAAEGKAFVYQGSWYGLPTTPDWTTESNQSGARLGWSVATAGDVNGDGFSEVIVGAWFYDNGQSNEGGAWLYSGSAGGIDDLPAWTGYGEHSGAHYSSAVAYAGDVNGDGFSDVLIGADTYSNVEPWLGRVYVHRGTEAGLLQEPDWLVDGEDPLSGFGSYLSTAGDVNGDGYSDVVLSAYSFDGPLGGDQGKVYLYHGSSSGLPSTPDWTMLGEQGDARFGESIATAGDVNGDGYSDLIVGSYWHQSPYFREGKVYVFHGTASGLPSSPSWTMEGNVEGMEFGVAVSTAGDVNGDGFSDVVVGIPFYDPFGYPEDTGAIAVYLGSASGPETDPHWFVWSDQGSAIMGIAVSTAGDINGDGYSDIIFSAARYDYPHNDEGVVWVKLGSADGLVGFPDWVQLGGMANAWYGNVLSTAGDVNGDGFDDVVIGAEGMEYDGLIGAGRASVHLGNLRLNSDPGLALIPRQAKAGGAPLELLCKSDSETEFRILVNGRSAAGRCRVRVSGNIAEVGQPIDGGLEGQGPWYDTGVPVMGEGSIVEIDELVENLTAETSYHWRLRVESNSPFFPRTPWMSMPSSVPSQKQLRMGGGASGIADDIAGGATSLKLLAVRPNPFTPRTAIIYALPVSGHVTLSIYSPAGRKVRTLVDGEQTAGRQVARWDGRDGNGDQAASGVYFARIESGQEERTVKLVLRR